MTVSLNGKNLIFIISQPRAGSTLLQRILTGDDRVHTTAEPWILLHQLYALRSTGHSAEYNVSLAYVATQEFCNNLPEGGEAYYHGIRQLACYLYNQAIESSPGKSIFVDKTPRYYHIIPELFHLFPEAKYLILFRNPLAVLSSILNQLVKDHYILLGRYQHDLLIAPEKLVDGVTLLGDQCRVVHYESLVTQPDAVLRSLCDFLNLNFADEMLEYGQREIPQGQMGDSSNINHYSSVTTTSLHKWLDMGKNRQTRHFAEEYLVKLGEELILKMGYESTSLREQLAQIKVEHGNFRYRWDSLFSHDEKSQKRMALIELALLEHSRLVHTGKKLFRARKSKDHSS